MNSDRGKTKARTSGLSHLHNGTLLSSWKEEGTLPVRAASEYVQNQTKLHPFFAPSFYKSKIGYSHEFHGLYQQRNTTSIPCFKAALCRAPSANKTTIAVRKQIFFNTICLHAYDPAIKLGSREGATNNARSPLSSM